MKKRKNGGFTLVEVLVYISIITILFTIVFNILQNQRQKQEFTIQKRNISQFIRKIQQYAQYNKKEYILDFRISENIAYFVDKENGKEDIIGKLEISKNISYMTNNNDKNADFKRKTTNEGNFEKGFSIYLLDKKGKKIYCYIEDYDGDITNVYKYYGMEVDPKDKPRKKRNIGQ